MTLQTSLIACLLSQGVKIIYRTKELEDQQAKRLVLLPFECYLLVLPCEISSYDNILHLLVFFLIADSKSFLDLLISCLDRTSTQGPLPLPLNQQEFVMSKQYENNPFKISSSLLSFPLVYYIVLQLHYLQLLQTINNSSLFLQS